MRALADGASPGAPGRAPRRAAWISSILGAVAGILLSRLVPTAAKPDELPGLAKAVGIDPRAYLLRLLIVAACPIAAGAAAALARRRRDRGEAAPPDAPDSPARGRLWMPAAAAHAIVAWTFLAPAVPGAAPIALLLLSLTASAALAIALGGGDPERGAPHLAAGAAALPLAFWTGRPLSVDVAAAAAVMALPVVSRAAAGFRARALRLLRGALVWVLLPGCVTALAAAATMKAHVADVFEDGHALLPASEYLRGERPYRDIVPGHGLISDGLVQSAAFRLSLFAGDLGGLHRADRVVGAAFWPSVYALGAAATGSPAAALGSLLLAFLAWPRYFYLRLLPALWAIALCVSASRRGSRARWFTAGALLTLAFCTGVEFAVYAAGAAAVALWVARGDRPRSLAAFAAGLAASSLAAALAFAAAGFLGPFVGTTFVLLPSLLPAYAIPLVRPALPPPAHWAAALADRTSLLYAFVLAAIVTLGALLPRGARLGPRARGMLPVLAWVVLAMASVVERRHVGYPFFLLPLGLVAIAGWIRGARPWTSARGIAAAAAVGAVVLAWRPWALAGDLAFALRHDWLPPGYTRLERPARARGAVFPPADAALVRATAEVLADPRVARDDTWLDFANAGGLYFLFDRDCPIRYYEVPYYESEAGQAEVIAAVEGNPRVRLVLISTGLPSEAMDGIPNAVRAPRVQRYIAERFAPFFKRGGVEFWMRRSSAEKVSAKRAGVASGGSSEVPRDRSQSRCRAPLQREDS